MLIIVAGIAVIVVMIGFLLLFYNLQKKDEEIRELKNIIRNAHERALNCKNSHVYASADAEVKQVLDYLIICTASTTALNPSPNYLKDILEIHKPS